MSQDITIKFQSQEAAYYFALWLCETGEQNYWDWIRYREEEEDGAITAVTFHYHGEGHSGDFMADWTIRTEAGRLDES